MGVKQTKVWNKLKTSDRIEMYQKKQLLENC